MADDEAPAEAEVRGARRDGVGASLLRTIRLAALAIAIVAGLAFGIPWLIGLVWK